MLHLQNNCMSCLLKSNMSGASTKTIWTLLNHVFRKGIYRVVSQSKVYCCLTLLSSGLKGEGYVALHPDCIQVPQNSSDSTEMHMHGSKPKHYDRSAMPPRFFSWLEHLESQFLPRLFFPLAVYRVIPALGGCVPSYL